MGIEMSADLCFRCHPSSDTAGYRCINHMADMLTDILGGEPRTATQTPNPIVTKVRKLWGCD